ncbi:uncharacterized protein LOC135482838 isoform X2 [Lineus longissimus]|uniref:uncharacterized protein LOC135482838 isoform X2 n=1 Tax=Lineus longissimus TaxID=88925 RepID=UPI002B4D6C4D
MKTSQIFVMLVTVCLAHAELAFLDVDIPGVTDDPRRLVAVHAYTKGLSNAATAACTLPLDEPGFGLIDDKNLGLGKSVKTQDCKTYTCLRVYETAQFDMALISEYDGCWYKNDCYLPGFEFRDDRCYKRTCEINRSKADNKIRSNIKFISTVADCPNADGGCVGPMTSNFDCFLNGVYESHCICKKKGSIVFLDSLMRFGAKVPTIGGNANGTYCFFKFWANGQYNNKCILEGRDKEWCATTDNYDRDGKWGYCTESPRYRYTKDSTKCHLPFKYNGMLYHDCTTDGSENGEAWCSTQFKYDPKKKGICDLSNE